MKQIDYDYRCGCCTYVVRHLCVMFGWQWEICTPADTAAFKRQARDFARTIRVED